jgi:murein DD-endopeptidase MepM/ murein hydrolase activator NlpD
MTSAAAKLQPSRLSNQRELLRDDLDLSSLNLGMKGRKSLQLVEAITGSDVTRTIEGASTITLTVADPDKTLLKSGFLTEELNVTVEKAHSVSEESAGLLAGNTDIEIDGLWFRLVGFNVKADRSIDLSFEDREVAVLKSWPPVNDRSKWVRKRNTTRFEFAKSLINDVKHILDIRFVCPDLVEQKPLLEGFDANGKLVQRAHGLTADQGITVKNKAATKEQLDILETVLETGLGLKARRKVLVAAIMTVTVESTAHNYKLGQGDQDSVGVFQQRPSQGWGTPAQLNSVGYGELAQDVQLSANPGAYDRWRIEAEHTVTAFLGTDSASGLAAQFQASSAAMLVQGQFVRGKPQTINGKQVYVRENNWDCLQRLAREIGFRCFCVSGTVYMISDGRLFRSKVAATISDDTDGVDSISGDYIQGKKNAQLTIACRAGRWQAPPGTPIAIVDMGPLDGRWMVAAINRPLTDTATTVTVKKPQPSLPEGRAPEHGAGQTSGTTYGGSGSTGSDGSTSGPQHQFEVPAGVSLVQPVPKPYIASHGGVHETAGLAGYPAIDFFAAPGSPVCAPEPGTVQRFSGHDPALGPIGPDGNPGGRAAAGGPLGWSLYLLGDSGTSYFMTHLDTRTCVVGQRVRTGLQLGTIADYDKWGRSSHVHVGVHGGAITIDTLGKAAKADATTQTTATGP